MQSELDRIKSTITISLGTKNRLRSLKDSMSYEEFINFLLRKFQEESKTDKNYIEVQKLKRKTAVYSIDSFKIVFSYNLYNKSPNYQFDISIDKIRQEGNIISFNKYIELIARKAHKDHKETEFRTYFELLSEAIRLEVEPLFRHNGRFEDHFSWKEEFKILNLPEKTYEEDVMQKLNNYQEGLHFDD